MKALFTLLSLSFFLSAPQAHAFLNTAQSQQAVAALNEACVDNWCEGAYDIHFEALRCSSRNRSCLLYMTIKNSYEEKSVAKNYSCLLEPLNSAADVFNPTFVGLSMEFTSTVSKCLSSLKP